MLHRQNGTVKMSHRQNIKNVIGFGGNYLLMCLRVVVSQDLILCFTILLYGLREAETV